MFPKLRFSFLFVLVLTLTSASFGDDPFFKLDMDEPTDVNTEAGFTSFLLEDSGSEVNGITIELLGNLDTRRRGGPNDLGGFISGEWHNEIYRDFIFAYYPDGIEMILWELGDGRKCDITIYAFDTDTGETRVANWSTPNEPNIIQTRFYGDYSSIFQWPYYKGDKDYYAFTGTVTADKYGRIILTSTIDPCSQDNEPFAYINALIVSPNSTGPGYIPVEEAIVPRPVNGQEDVFADVVLSWRAGAFADKHDVYFGTDETAVTDANRDNPLGVLVSQNHLTATYAPPGFIDFNTTYYWRIDEVNDPNIWKGEVWSFTTLPYFVVENFDSYEDNSDLRSVWQKGSTSAEVSVETAIVRDGNSMEYQYRNNLAPYYSEAYADISDLGIDDPDWLKTGAETLELRFHVEPNYPFSEQMYVGLTDGDNPAGTATVTYNDVNGVWAKQWNKWSIALTEFNDVNLANIAGITIGFGDGSPGDSGTVYFEDIQLDGEVEVLPKVVVSVGTVYQELEGFGAGDGFAESWVTGIPQPQRNGFYDLVFNDLGLDIYRIRNNYNHDDGPTYMGDTAEIVAAAELRNPSIKIIIAAWSPEDSLKSNNDIGYGTLDKDSTDPNNTPPYYYVYKKYAQWWYDSLLTWEVNGVVVDYVEIQNEPDYDAWYGSCRFDPTESEEIAGYSQAFAEVYQKLESEMSVMPKMIVPGTTGLNFLSDYIDNIADSNHVYGYAHHLYNGGGLFNNADGYINEMTFYATNYGDKPLMMTEFSKGGDGDVNNFEEAMNLACLMHNSLVFESVSAYVYWELYSPSPKGLVCFPSFGTYETNPVYYAFKHYAAFTDPGWHRVGASSDFGSLGDVRVSAFQNPENNQLTVVIINKSPSSTDIKFLPGGFTPTSSEVYRSSETASWLYLGTYGSSLTLPGNSITTIHMTGTTPSNCAEVLAAGCGLTSDIHDDCYVDFKDFGVVAKYWLNTNCASQNDCEGADFEPSDGDVDYSDIGTFVQQWLWCNDPNDDNCTANW